MVVTSVRAVRLPIAPSSIPASTRSEPFCGVWVWAARNIDGIEAARAAFDARGTA